MLDYDRVHRPDRLVIPARWSLIELHKPHTIKTAPASIPTLAFSTTPTAASAIPINTCAIARWRPCNKNNIRCLQLWLTWRRRRPR
jgi:hypothetical protein